MDTKLEWSDVKGTDMKERGLGPRANIEKKHKTGKCSELKIDAPTQNEEKARD